MQEFETLYREYYPLVYQYLYKLCQNENLAEELTQDTFFKILRNIDKYHGDCKFSVWACQIAKNSLYTYIKKNRRNTDFPVEILSEDNNFEQKIEDKDLALKIHEVLHEIEEPYREVFWMRTFGELSFADIGKVHKKSEVWARVTYHRAKVRIQEVLDEKKYKM